MLTENIGLSTPFPPPFFITAIKVYLSDKSRRFISRLCVRDETEVWQSRLDILKLSHMKL